VLYHLHHSTSPELYSLRIHWSFLLLGIVAHICNHSNVIPAFGRLRKKNPKFEHSPDYIARLCLKNKYPGTTDRQKLHM
jgi:hypothetical protein